MKNNALSICISLHIGHLHVTLYNICLCYIKGNALPRLSKTCLMNTNALLQKYGSWERDTTLQSSFYFKTFRNKEFNLQQWA